jgi:peroxidase
LKQYNSFAQLTADPVLQKSLQTVYGSINNVDLFIGGLAEKHASGAVVGPTFQAIIADQFQALRTGDRFFWLNQGFDSRTASMISNTTLADIMQRNTATPNLQANVFIEAPLTGHTHVQPHATQPAAIDTHGRKGSPFINDGM